jgi:hypothetical protein
VRMPDQLKKLPWGLIIQVLSIIFAAGVAYATFAPKEWVQDRIKDHEVRTEQARKDDMREIKEILKRIEDRQYELARQPIKR